MENENGGFKMGFYVEEMLKKRDSLFIKKSDLLTELKKLEKEESDLESLKSEQVDKNKALIKISEKIVKKAEEYLAAVLECNDFVTTNFGNTKQSDV